MGAVYFLCSNQRIKKQIKDIYFSFRRANFLKLYYIIIFSSFNLSAVGRPFLFQPLKE